jgi:N-acylneuraminate cytidylyltransferase
MKKNKILYLIPARGGSKGLPGKNIKLLGGKPLINYSINFARKFTNDLNICVSTDDDDIIKCANELNLKIPFKRPHELATDFATTKDVMIHAINYYESIGIYFDVLVLLQPTSPFRKTEDLKIMLDKYNDNIDLLVSVKEPHDSPYFNIFEENSEGYLLKSKESKATRRQDCPNVYAFNGSLYIYKVSSVKSNQIKSIKKHVMQDPIYSIDIDTEFDFMICQNIINNKLL